MKNSHEFVGVVGHYGPAAKQTKGTEQQVHAMSKSRQYQKREFFNLLSSFVYQTLTFYYFISFQSITCQRILYTNGGLRAAGVMSNAVKTSNNKPQLHERQRSSRSVQKVNKAQAKGEYEDSDVKKVIHGSWAAKQALKEREALDLRATTMGKKTKFADSDDE